MFFLEKYNPDNISLKIAENLKQRRLNFNLTQKALSKRSGVSLGSLKRFETTGEISLKNLILLAIGLQSSDELIDLFERQDYNSIEDVIRAKNIKSRKRGRRND